MATGGKVECSYCSGDASLVHVKCMECSNTIVCLPCFSKGVEFRSHQRTHSYKVIDKGAFSICDENWTAHEEKMLLDGIEQFGIGNWEEVGSYIGNRTSKEVEEHYYGAYIESIDLGRATVPHDIPNRVTDHTPPLHESILSVQLPSIDISKDLESQLAYMPLRDDYEMENDNEAESLISSLAITGDEDDVDIGLKLAHINMYLEKLRERHRRKSVAREYHLVEKFFGRNDRDYLKRLHICFQYMREEQAVNFAKDHRKEQHLKARIKHLKTYRKNGIKKLEDGIVFDVKQRRRSRAKSSSGFRSGFADLTEKHVDRMSMEFGHHLLSSEEKSLCKTLKLIPSRYLTLKTLIIKDFIQKQHGLGIKVRFPSYLEKFQRKKIISFLTANGWLPRLSS